MTGHRHSTIDLKDDQCRYKRQRCTAGSYWCVNGHGNFRMTRTVTSSVLITKMMLTSSEGLKYLQRGIICDGGAGR